MDLEIGKEYEYTININRPTPQIDDRTWYLCTVIAFDEGDPVIRTDKGHYHRRPVGKYAFRLPSKKYPQQGEIWTSKLIHAEAMVIDTANIAPGCTLPASVIYAVKDSIFVRTLDDWNENMRRVS